jgi:hypothetical protein
MNTDRLKALEKKEIPTLSKNLGAADIRFLVRSLDEKDDNMRYNAFLLLQANSREFPFVYGYWNGLENKLESLNSYQRSMGAKLIAENVRWDKHGGFRRTISKYLSCCNDEKPITARQAIQALAVVLESTDKYDDEVKQGLSNLRLLQYNEGMQKLIRKDISNILKIIEDKNRKPK